MLACIGLPDRDPSWERSFSHWLLGVCDHLVPAQEHFHPEEWARRTRYIYNWTEPHNRYTVHYTQNPEGPLEGWGEKPTLHGESMGFC